MNYWSVTSQDCSGILSWMSCANVGYNLLLKVLNEKITTLEYALWWVVLENFKSGIVHNSHGVDFQKKSHGIKISEDAELLLHNNTN